MADTPPPGAGMGAEASASSWSHESFFGYLHGLVEARNSKRRADALSEDIIAMDIEPGALIVSSPLGSAGALMGPRQVALVIDADDKDGVIAVILHKMSGEPAAQYVPQWEDVLAKPKAMFVGSAPLSATTGYRGSGLRSLLTAVGMLKTGRELPPAERYAPVTNRLGLVDVHGPAEPLIEDIECLRVFVGGVHWGYEDLRVALDEGEYFLAPALPQDVFRPVHFDLWGDVMRRQGPTFAVFAGMPHPYGLYNN